MKPIHSSVEISDIWTNSMDSFCGCNVVVDLVQCTNVPYIMHHRRLMKTIHLSTNLIATSYTFFYQIIEISIIILWSFNKWNNLFPLKRQIAKTIRINQYRLTFQPQRIAILHSGVSFNFKIKGEKQKILLSKKSNDKLKEIVSPCVPDNHKKKK